MRNEESKQADNGEDNDDGEELEAEVGQFSDTVTSDNKDDELQGQACYAFEKEYHMVRMYTRNAVEKRSIIPEQIWQLAKKIFSLADISFSQLQYLQIWALGPQDAKTLMNLCAIPDIEELVEAPLPLPADKADYEQVKARVADWAHLIQQQQPAANAANQSVQSGNHTSAPPPTSSVSTNVDNPMQGHQPSVVQQKYSHPLSGKLQFGECHKVHQNDSKSEMVQLSITVNDEAHDEVFYNCLMLCHMIIF